MGKNDERLYRALKGGSDSLELLQGGTSSRSAAVGASINQIVGNPAFKAEITLQVQVRYYSQAVVGTPVAAVPAVGQQGDLPLYLVGNIDYRGNYSRCRQFVAGQAGWNYADTAMICVGDGRTGYFPLPHAAGSVENISGTIFNNLAMNGDLLFLIPMAGYVAGAAGTTHCAEILIRCTNVPYTSFLSALASDLMTINMIRYVVPVAAVAQFTRQLTLVKSSLFGKSSQDTLDPQAFITPSTFQPQICDIPLTLPVDKNIAIATTIMYTAVVPIVLSMTVTVEAINKLTN